MSTGTLTDTQRGLHAPVYFIVDRSSSDLILTSPAQPGIYYINLAALMDTVGGEVKVSEIDFDGGIDFNGDTPAASPLLFTGVTLPANSNVIRGIDIVPTRVSGWTAFTGLVGATPAQVYTDYRELHTEGVAEVLGAGQFVFMDSGASCKSLFAEQNIAEVDAGATVLTAAGAPAVGIFAVWNKTLLNGETFNAGGVAAVEFLSFQANVTDVSAEDTSIWNVEVASGKIRSLMHLIGTGNVFASNFFELSAEMEPVIAPAGYTDPNGAAPEKALHIKIGATEYMIPLYQKTP